MRAPIDKACKKAQGGFGKVWTSAVPQARRVSIALKACCVTDHFVERELDVIRQVKAYAKISALSLLAACTSSQQTSQPNSAMLPQAHVSANAVGLPAKVKTCFGTNGVMAHPCPVVINLKPGVRLTVSGPGVYYSAWSYLNPCDYERYCIPRQLDRLHWELKPGPKCGTLYPEISGLNASDQLVGVYYFKLTNHLCHHHRQVSKV
jgi:hypothetical protein